MKNFFVLILGVLFLQPASAQEVGPWANETEASVVKVSGNTKSENYSLKQKSSYTFEMNTMVAAARYVQSKAGATEIGKAWDASLRYERALNDQWSLFIQQTAESDAFAGYVQRDSTDLGAKYFFIKDKDQSLFVEGGARQSKTNPVGAGSSESNLSLRTYLEWTRQLNEAVSGKFWVEYLPNSKKQDAYLVNYEPSLSVVMTKTFSMKLSYLVKYHNDITKPDEEKTDSTLTTSIVAKF